MIDPQIKIVLIRTFIGGLIGMAGAIILRLTNRESKESARMEQVTAVGFLIGAAFGATFGIFESMMHR